MLYVAPNYDFSMAGVFVLLEKGDVVGAKEYALRGMIVHYGRSLPELNWIGNPEDLIFKKFEDGVATVSYDGKEYSFPFNINDFLTVRGFLDEKDLFEVMNAAPDGTPTGSFGKGV